jgi:protein required for attachment to host cells
MAPHRPITEKTWVAVFDGGRAATFENEGFDDAPNLRYVSGARSENLPSRELVSDKPGRYPTPAGGRAATGGADPHEEEEHRFVKDYAGEIESAAKAGRFDRLVAIAPAKLLALFLSCAPLAEGKLAGSRAGDFAHAPVDQIERAFREALADVR